MRCCRLKGYEDGPVRYECSTASLLEDICMPCRSIATLCQVDPRDPRADLARIILRKEVIQPQVPLRLPCYDFTPVAEPTVVGCLPCGLAHHLRVDPTPMV
jgi:hypothetical protein